MDKNLKKKILLVFGTRPEAIKMCPLVNELKKRDGIRTMVCVTGQHRQMLDQVLHTFHVRPDYDLSVMREKQTLFDITTNILNGIKEVLEKEEPDIVLVHGDTSTTFATALACFYLQIPVGHVEAGLRTNNIYSPYPEEFNRQAVAIISQYNFAPTLKAKENLVSEGREEGNIWVTGNTVIDALKTTVREDYEHPELEWAKGSRLIFITAHRRENLGEPMHRMFRAVRRVLMEYPDVKALYPIHMNPAVRRAAKKELGGLDRIHIIEPVEVFDCHNLMARSYLILTDSGGIQEEAPSLGKPVLVMRDTTERPEGIAAGTLKLVGTKEETIYRNFKRLLEDRKAYEEMAHANNPYGDGNASRRIADILEMGQADSYLQLDSQVADIICKALGVECSGIKEIKNLKTGMTNRSFSFVCKGKKYIMRIPGEGTNRLINREREAAVYRAIQDKNICDSIIYINSGNGYKITEFLPNARVCNPMDDQDVRKCMKRLRSFHELNLTVDHVFDIFGQIEFYEELWKGVPSSYDDYGTTKAGVMSLKGYIDKHRAEYVLSHIDAVSDNFLFVEEDGRENVYLIDWEYAGMQDPHLDIAMFAVYSSYDRERIDSLISSYFPEGCSENVRIKIYCYISVCGLLWSNWCEYKKILGVEFGEYAIRQYHYAKEYYRIAKSEIEKIGDDRSA